MENGSTHCTHVVSVLVNFSFIWDQDVDIFSELLVYWFALILSLLAAKHSHKLLRLLPVVHLFLGFAVLCCTFEVLLTLSFKVNLTFFTFENQRNYFLTWHRLTAGYHSHQGLYLWYFSSALFLKYWDTSSQLCDPTITRNLLSFFL